MSLLRYHGALYRAAESSFEDQAREKALYLRRSRKRFRDLVLQNQDTLLAAMHQSRAQHPNDVARQSVAWKQSVSALPVVVEFLRLTNRRRSEADTKYLLDRLADVVLHAQPLDKVTQKLSLFLDTSYTAYRQEQSKQPMLRAGLPPEVIKQLLPKSFAFKIAPNSDLVEELSIYGNKAKTEIAKTAAMAQLLRKWNDLVATLNQDLGSDDPFTKLCAIVTSIIVHTGIRPGAEGASRLRDDTRQIVRDEAGAPIRIKTVGATGLRREHIKFLRDDFVQLQFRGKAATMNVADLTDADLIQALREHIDSVSHQGSDTAVFTTRDGRQVSDKDVNAYLKRVVGTHISATDFRKLKATREFYDSLRRRKSALAKELRALKIRVKRDLRNRIVRTIVRHILESAVEAQKAISHSDVRVTIESYISPRVVLEYLNNAGLARGLEEVVSNSHGMKVRFDPFDFYNKMIQQEVATAAVRRAETEFLVGDKFSDTDLNAAIDAMEQ